jgi:hypothetical protein
VGTSCVFVNERSDGICVCQCHETITMSVVGGGLEELSSTAIWRVSGSQGENGA